MIDGTPCHDGWDYYNGMIEALNKNEAGKIRKRTRPPAVIFFRLALHCLVQHYSNPDFLSLFDNIYLPTILVTHRVCTSYHIQKFWLVYFVERIIFFLFLNVTFFLGRRMRISFSLVVPKCSNSISLACFQQKPQVVGTAVHQ